MLNQSWDLSLVGDWNSITENAAQQNRTHGPTHELLTVASQSVTHDAKGNMTSIPAVLRPGSDPLKMKWDFENKLIAADTDNDSVDDIFYRFDALGRRVGRDDGTANVVHFQDGQQTIADYPAGTAAGSPTYTYVYASYIDEPVLRGGSGGLRYYHRNQQYSITALTDGGGTIIERYAYTAYGQVTFANASGTVQSASVSNNRYTYTGREWDVGLDLYYYRARMHDPASGRFVSRDPIGFRGSPFNTYRYVSNQPSVKADPLGLKDCKITIYAGHNFNIKDAIDQDYPNPGGTMGGGDPWNIPDGHCVAGVGCGSGVDVDGDGTPDSFQDYPDHYYPCNSIYAPHLCNWDDPTDGLSAEIACAQLSKTYQMAVKAAKRMVAEVPPNPQSSRECKPECDKVEVIIKCDEAMRQLSDDFMWEGRPAPGPARRACNGICDKTYTAR